MEGGTAAFVGERIVAVRAENRRQLLRILDKKGRELYGEVLEPGGTLFAAGNDSFLLSDCTSDRCPTLWRYRLP